MGVSMGVNLSAETGRLEVCFGGFAPTAMKAGASLDEVVDRAEHRAREQRKMREHAAALESARASEPREWIDEGGSRWSYVLLDGVQVRIECCLQAASAHLLIPSEIEGLDVVALAPDACAYLQELREVTCPDTLLHVGLCAFRGCKRLERAILPAQLAYYDSGWFRNCDKLAYLRLPGNLGELDASIFDAPSLRVLEVGAGTYGVAPGAFAKSQLERIEVDRANPHIGTDGKALYTADRSVMLALCVPERTSEVLEGCRAIARKGFSGFSCVEEVALPATLEEVGGFAFWRTGLHAFEGPAALRRVGEKAFFGCRKLTKVSFAEGLASLGQDALTDTGISSLRLPSTIEELGHPLAARTALTYAGSEATFSIAEGPGPLRLDGKGGLYRVDERGKRFEVMLDPQAVEYAVEPDAYEVAAGSFADNRSIRRVHLPDGLGAIGAGAFKGCRALTQVNIPESVRVVGDEAFLGTNIERVYLPAGLERLGKNALITQGAHHNASVGRSRMAPSLREVAIGEGSERFVMQDGLLLERAGTDGSLRLLLCVGGVDVVRIPPKVNEVAPYALNNVRGVRELHLTDGIVLVGIRGLALEGFVELIRVDMLRDKESPRGFYELRFPDTDRGRQQMMLALSVPNHVSVEILFEHYDNAITNGSSFDAATERGLPLYEQATRLIRRLQDPVFLKPVNAQMCERFLRDNAEAICVELARHDDRAALDSMLDLGFLHEGNIFAVIDRIGAVQDASLTNYLLEARRMRFQQTVFDDLDL